MSRWRTVPYDGFFKWQVQEKVLFFWVRRFRTDYWEEAQRMVENMNKQSTERSAP